MLYFGCIGRAGHFTWQDERDWARKEPMRTFLEWSPPGSPDVPQLHHLFNDNITVLATYVAGRRLSADFALVTPRLLVEVQGGIYKRLAHGSVSGVLKDNERLNAATLSGWRLLRVTPQEVDSGYALTLIEQALATVAAR